MPLNVGAPSQHDRLEHDAATATNETATPRMVTDVRAGAADGAAEQAGDDRADERRERR